MRSERDVNMALRILRKKACVDSQSLSELKIA
jgi:hypothetical protein